jgi:hypothetical protein
MDQGDNSMNESGPVSGSNSLNVAARPRWTGLRCCVFPGWDRWLAWLAWTLFVLALASVLGPGMVSLKAVAGGLLVTLIVTYLLVPRRRRALRWLCATIVLTGLVALGVRQSQRYRTEPRMELGIREYSNAEYPEDPAQRSPSHGAYNGRTLKLVHRGGSLFDFEFSSVHPHVADITLSEIDVALMTPALPDWCRSHQGNTRIALTDRQWNRQQVSFSADSRHVRISGGDGFEARNVVSVELAKNCLNAGLWELLLFTQGAGGKELYYQGWFTFPLGHYEKLFEAGTGLSYADHWYYLEHWFDPAGTEVALDDLRKVVTPIPITVEDHSADAIVVAGEQLRKRRTVIGQNIRTFDGFNAGAPVKFAAFVPPGRYSVDIPWSHEYRRIETVRHVELRCVQPASGSLPALELEFHFESPAGEPCRFLISGFRWDDLPQLSVEEYPRSLYMPMGIGVPPFFQSYSDLEAAPPHKSDYFCLLLDEQNRWIDHHKVAIDGPVMHRDLQDPNRLHVYLLSYERHSLIRHFVVSREACPATTSLPGGPEKLVSDGGQ